MHTGKQRNKAADRRDEILAEIATTGSRIRELEKQIAYYDEREIESERGTWYTEIDTRNGCGEIAKINVYELRTELKSKKYKLAVLKDQLLDCDEILFDNQLTFTETLPRIQGALFS